MASLLYIGLFGAVSFIIGLILRTFNLSSFEGYDVLIIGGGYALTISMITITVKTVIEYKTGKDWSVK